MAPRRDSVRTSFYNSKCAYVYLYVICKFLSPVGVRKQENMNLKFLNQILEKACLLHVTKHISEHHRRAGVLDSLYM